MTRATTPPAARSKSARDVGSTLPCARATARSGASTWASGALATPLVILDMLEYALGKSRGRDLGRTGHQPREIVCNAPRPDRPNEPARDRRRHIIPPELLEHHRSRQDHASRVHFVLPRVLGRGAVRRLEHGEAVAHITAGRESEPTHLGRRGVRQQVAVQVGRGDHRVLVGTQHELREHRIGDAVLHDHLSRFPFPLSRVVFRDGLIPEPALRDLVPPLPEPALGELHDVALVNERDRAATGTQRVLDRLRDQALGAELGHRLDADRAPGADLGREPLAAKSDDGIGLWAAGPGLDPGGHFPDGGVEHAPGGAPDVGPGAVAFDEGNDGVARHHPTTVAVFDALAHGQAVYTARPGLRQAKRWPYT